MAADDFQVGNNSTSTMTPGSAVAGQLQDILAQKRAYARQSMLDDLNRQNVQSEIAYRGQQANSLEEQRQAVAEWRKSQAANAGAQELTRRAGLLTPGAPLQGSDLSYFNENAPSLVKPGQPQVGNVDYTSGDQGPVLPATSPSFVGLPKQIDEQRHQNLQDELLKRMQTPEWGALPPAAQEAQYMGAFGKSIPENVLANSAGEAPLMEFDEASNTMKPLNGPDGKPIMGKKGEIVRRGFPPQPNAAAQPQLYQLTVPNPDDPTQTHLETHMFTPTEMKQYLDAHPEIQGSKGNPPKPTKAPQVSPSEASKLSGLRTKAQPTHRFGESLIGPKTADPKDVQAYRQEAIQAVSKLNLSKKIEHAFIDVMNDDKAEPLSSSVIAAGHDDFTKNEQDTLEQALLSVRGK